MNEQIWGKQNDLNYDGNCTSRDCLGGTYEISGRWIFVGRSVHEVRWTDEHEEANSAFCDYVNVHENPPSTRNLECVFRLQFNLP